MNQQLIEEAMRQKSVIEFTYNGHPRVVEPHVLGISGGSKQFLGYQIGGSSSSRGALPEWRRFDLAGLGQPRITTDSFAGQRPCPSERHSAWDKVILTVEK